VGRKVDGRRKPEIGTKAEPGTGQRRKLQMSSKAELEGWWKGASPKLSGRHSRKVDKRRKLKVGAKAKPRMQQPMRVGG